MREGSLINAESTNSSSNGGNVFVNTDFLVGVPYGNNDIIANAVGGNGGRVEVNAISILGFTTSNGFSTSVLRGNRTNDLSASSQTGVDGEVVLNTLAVDPASGLLELPANLTDRADQIAPGCGLGNADAGSQFVITGEGGLPPSASDTMTDDAVGVPWVMADDRAALAAVPAVPQDPAPLVEAQGMTVDATGQAFLVGAGSDRAALCAARVLR